MDPVPKRPRLSVFLHEPSDADLHNARHSNDMTLKDKFESIFAKYSKDFTQIGDEVDLMTGQIVVNNGHIDSLKTETDPGIDRLAKDFSSAGRSILHAMTLPPDSNIPGPDDILVSIETIAENAGLVDELSQSESEDALFDEGSNSTSSGFSSSQTISKEDGHQRRIQPYNSDSDSLFGEEEETRPGSPDSLFDRQSEENEDAPSPTADFSRPEKATLPSLSLLTESDRILAKFGPEIGQEVLDLIGQQKQAHIEPAWRIPVQIEGPVMQRPKSRALASSLMTEAPASGQKRSLWRSRSTKDLRTPRRDSSPRITRDESVDPLQEDFSSESEAFQGREPNVLTSDDNSDEDSDFQCLANLLQQIEFSGDCPYCNVHYQNKRGVMAHWDRWLVGTANQETVDEHDEKVIRMVRSQAKRRVRLERLIIYDFRTMIELHEGAGISFEEIAGSGTLRSRKSGPQLQAIYNSYRTPPAWRSVSDRTQKWTQEEDKILKRMCKNSLTTIATLRRKLKDRTDLEIGNHLAEIWLGELVRMDNQRPDSASVGRERMTNSQASSTPMRSRAANRGINHEPAIKREDSEDELFGR